jgi:hypothetical protein
VIIRVWCYVVVLCFACTLTASADPLALLRSLKQGIAEPSDSLPVSAAVSSGVNGSVGCVVYTKREVKQITNRQYRRHVAFMCFSDLGDILGSVVTRKGVPACTIFGTYDPLTQCLYLSGCGFPTVVC